MVLPSLEIGVNRIVIEYNAMKMSAGLQGSTARFPVARVDEHEKGGVVPNEGWDPTPPPMVSAREAPLSPTVLVLTSRADVAAYAEEVLGSAGVPVSVINDEDGARTSIGKRDSKIGLLLVDVEAPRIDGTGAMQRIHSDWPELPVVILSAENSSIAMEVALERGASAFVRLPVQRGDLLNRVTELLRAQPGQLPARNDAFGLSAGPFCCTNARMQAIRSSVRRIARFDVPVLVLGESGVGKEVLARQLHVSSHRAGKPFLKLNCAAFPSELLESEMFGYERGAFTGAQKTTQGRLEIADGGTVLLDEIGDMELRLQAKLLHVLQDGEFLRVGGREPVRVNIRVVAATHQDLQRAIEEGRFRADLYYRLAVLAIEIPPLRERQDEIVPMAEYFLRKHCIPGTRSPGITAELREALLAYDWPGNVRELENVMQRLLVLEDTTSVIRELQANMLRRSGNRRMSASSLHGNEGARPESASRRRSAFEEANQAKATIEAKAIRIALNATHWNRRKAAALLNIGYKTLLHRMKRLGIDVDADGSLADQKLA